MNPNQAFIDREYKGGDMLCTRQQSDVIKSLILKINERKPSYYPVYHRASNHLWGGMIPLNHITFDQAAQMMLHLKEVLND